MNETLTPRQHALVALGETLLRDGYRFVTPTPATHQQFLSANPHDARDLRDVFGWSRAFAPHVLPSRIAELMEAAGAVTSATGGLQRSIVRFSTIGDVGYFHSAFPTTASDAVFFGPDTYRFVNLLRERVTSARVAVDIGCGTGAGGLSLATRCETLILADTNAAALALAHVNAALANCHRNVQLVTSDLFSAVTGPIDLVVANPPYLADADARTYRDGGGTLGTGLSERIVRQSLQRLNAGGRLILYTASPIVNGEDTLWRAIAAALTDDVTFRYDELDPDVFGEELARPAYHGVERIALVCLDVVTTRRATVRATPRL